MVKSAGHQLKPLMFAVALVVVLFFYLQQTGQSVWLGNRFELWDSNLRVTTWPYAQYCNIQSFGEPDELLIRLLKRLWNTKGRVLQYELLRIAVFGDTGLLWLVRS